MTKKWVSLAIAGMIPLVGLSLGSCQNSTLSSLPMSHGNSTSVAHDMGEMSLGPKDENFDLRFIDAMTLHHQGAIDMAQDVLNKSTRPEMQKFAEAIIAAQQQEIEQMQQWRQAWYPSVSDEPMMYHAEANHMMPMTTEMRSAMTMSMDLGAADDNYDLRFLDAMIPHHAGALVMAQDALQNSNRPELRELAQAIVDAQQQEIDQMQQWKQQWYSQ